jgi:molybdopterin-guanine dinucleotide biosynthesis protein A
VESNIKNIQVVPDRKPDCGPLMGISAALQASINDTNFVIACDMPDIDISAVKKMLRKSENFDAVIPVSHDSKLQPLFAVYKKSILPSIEDALSKGIYKIIDAIADCNINYIQLSQPHRLYNLNTINDYERYINEKKPFA